MAYPTTVISKPISKSGLLTYRITKKDNIAYKIVFVKSIGRNKLNKRTVYFSPMDNKDILFPNTKEIGNMTISIVSKEQAIDYYNDFPSDNNIRLYQCEIPQGTRYLYGKYEYWATKESIAIAKEIETLAVEELILTKDITNEI